VVKCHHGIEDMVAGIQSQTVDRTVYSYRDPMTALASCVDQFCARPMFSQDWDFDRAVGRIEDGLEIGRRLRAMPGVLVVDLHADGEEASLDAILAHVGLDLSAPQRDTLLHEYAFSRMRQRSAEIAELPRESLLRGCNDPQTLMHPHHVDKGRSRVWADELTREQIHHAYVTFAAYRDLVPRQRSGPAASPSRWHRSSAGFTRPM
jgi:hypothetical protein